MFTCQRHLQRTSIMSVVHISQECVCNSRREYVLFVCLPLCSECCRRTGRWQQRRPWPKVCQNDLVSRFGFFCFCSGPWGHITSTHIPASLPRSMHTRLAIISSLGTRMRVLGCMCERVCVCVPGFRGLVVHWLSKRESSDRLIQHTHTHTHSHFLLCHCVTLCDRGPALFPGFHWAFSIAPSSVYSFSPLHWRMQKCLKETWGHQSIIPEIVDIPWRMTSNYLLGKF